MSNHLRKGILSSVLLVVNGIANKSVGLVSTLILARILLPEDFGIIAIATLMISFLHVLSTAGSQTYLLRVDNLDNDKVNTAYTINLIFKSLLSIIMIPSSFVIAHLYGDPRITTILILMTLFFFLEALNNPGLAFLRREQNYTKIVKMSIIVKILSVISGVTAAFLLKNYWALVIGQATSAVLMNIGSYIIYQYKPKLILINAREQWQFSGWMIPQSIFGYLRSHLSTFMVSSAYGQSALGSFQTMKYIAFMPSSEVILPMSQTFLVELTNAKVSQSYFNKQFKASFILLMLIALPIGAIMYFDHYLVTALILGPNWTKYSYLMSAFALLIPSSVLLAQATRVLLVYGKTKQMFFYDCIGFVVIYGSLFAYGLDDLEAFSFLLVGLEFLFAFIYFLFILIRYTGLISSFKFAVSVIPLIVGVIVGKLISDYLRVTGVNIFVELFTTTVSYLLTFFILVFTLYFAGFKKISEWEYLANLLSRSINPVLIKLKVSR
jgi:lipopolysaccharide exporter